MNGNGQAVQCPKCEWKPDGKPYWECECGHSWNTFDTRGKCPSCGKQWQTTQCHACGKWSPHSRWYTKGAGAKKAVAHAKG